jgi:hypothetical protein
VDDDFAFDHSSTISKTKESASSLQLIGTVHCKLYVTIKTAKKEIKSHKWFLLDLHRSQAIWIDSRL